MRPPGSTVPALPRALVSVDVEDADATETANLLRAAGAERVDIYCEEGWFG